MDVALCPGDVRKFLEQIVFFVPVFSAQACVIIVQSEALGQVKAVCSQAEVVSIDLMTGALKF